MTVDGAVHPGRAAAIRAAVPELLRGVLRRLEGRDLALISAGLTFYAGVAVVPPLVLAFG